MILIEDRLNARRAVIVQDDVAALLVYMGMRFICTYLLSPNLRGFLWLQEAKAIL
jgi:hypothetical protein